MTERRDLTASLDTGWSCHSGTRARRCSSSLEIARGRKLPLTLSQLREKAAHAVERAHAVDDHWEAFYVLWPAVEADPLRTAIGIEFESELRRDHHLPTERSESFADELFVLERAVKHPGAMPPMGGVTLSKDEVNAVAAYVWALGHHATR